MPSKSAPSGSGTAKSSWVKFIDKSIFATTYIEEYVPINTPSISARLKPRINSPPNINKANTLIVLLMKWWLFFQESDSEKGLPYL